jgi:hypothetical protein
VVFEASVACERADGARSRDLHRVQNLLRSIESRPLFEVEAQPPSHRERERQVLVGLIWDGAWA